MITVSGKALGRKKPLFADFSVPAPTGVGEGGSITLRELITCVVRHEVEAFKKRQEDRRFIHVLTAKQIDEGAEKGKIDMGGRDQVQKVDVDTAIATALEAFEDGLYLVVVDGQEQKKLDEQITLQPDSRVAFVRLTMLAGG